METKSVAFVKKVNKGKVYNFKVVCSDFIAVHWQINGLLGLSRAFQNICVFGCSAVMNHNYSTLQRGHKQIMKLRMFFLHQRCL